MNGALQHIFVVILSVLVSMDCGNEGRIIPTSDPDFVRLETPELLEECSDQESELVCEENCVHSCTPSTDQPMTCPTIPTSRPTRIADANCVCTETRCIWE